MYSIINNLFWMFQKNKLKIEKQNEELDKKTKRKKERKIENI